MTTMRMCLLPNGWAASGGTAGERRRREQPGIGAGRGTPVTGKAPCPVHFLLFHKSHHLTISPEDILMRTRNSDVVATCEITGNVLVMGQSRNHWNQKKDPSPNFRNVHYPLSNNCVSELNVLSLWALKAERREMKETVWGWKWDPERKRRKEGAPWRRSTKKHTWLLWWKRGPSSTLFRISMTDPQGVVLLRMPRGSWERSLQMLVSEVGDGYSCSFG